MTFLARDQFAMMLIIYMPINGMYIENKTKWKKTNLRATKLIHRHYNSIAKYLEGIRVQLQVNSKYRVLFPI